MSRSIRHEIGVGLIVLLAAGLTGWMALSVGSFGMGGHQAYTADFEDAAGIKKGASVSVAGVSVGKVGGLSLSEGHARIRLLVDPEIALHEDARALIRARSVLGEKYIALEPGSAGAPLLQGEHIHHTQGQVEIDQLLTQIGSVFEGVDAEKLGLAVDAFAAAFEQDPERPTRMLEGAEALIQELRDLTQLGAGMAREGQQAAEILGTLSQRAHSVLARSDRVLADLELAAGHLPTSAEGIPLLVEDARAATADMRSILDSFRGQKEAIERIIVNLSELDKWELRRLLREEGILIRLRQSEVDAASSSEDARAEP
jgi:phospholipid/cholesterol/gamma-HCH transport system substrate-binding protein